MYCLTASCVLQELAERFQDSAAGYWSNLSTAVDMLRVELAKLPDPGATHGACRQGGMDSLSCS